MILNVTRDRVLCSIRVGERKRPSGVIVIDRPYDFNVRSDVGTRAVVLAVGPGQHEVRPGDEVIVNKFGGIEFELMGEELVIFDSNELLAIVEDDPDEWLGRSIR